VLFEQPLGWEDYPLVSHFALAFLVLMGRALPPSKRQACKRHRSPEQTRYDTQRHDAQGPDDHKPADAAELQLQCRQCPAGGSRCRGLNPSMTGYCYSLIEGSVEFEIVVASQDYIFECP
jgi:hypothetical protein